ncbi:hypothetical protein R3P38DRAFT_2789089 [Favolaschia claudopus]|uniref:Uncharacterized protein n=1 Tax=Favolaschia claudopus TaxID=2862362 RepID=A0AAW0AL25_9AGAR
MPIQQQPQQAVLAAKPTPTMRCHDTSPSGERDFEQMPALDVQSSGAIALTRPIDVPRPGHQPRLLAAGRQMPAIRVDAYNSELCACVNPCAVAAATAAPRSGAIASTRRIAVPRATLSVLAAGRLTPPPTRKAAGPASLSRRMRCFRRRHPRRAAARIPVTIWIFFPRAGPRVWAAGRLTPAPDLSSSETCSPQFPSSIFRRPLSNVSTPLNQNLSAARLHHHHQALKSKFDFFARPPSDASGCPSGNFLPAARATSSSSARETPNRKFEIRCSRERGFDSAGVQCWFFSSAARRTSKFSTYSTAAANLSSPRSRSIFSSLRGEVSVFSSAARHLAQVSILQVLQEFAFTNTNALKASNTQWDLQEYEGIRRRVRTRTLETARETGFSRVQNQNFLPGSK